MDTLQKTYGIARKRSALTLSLVCLVFGLLPLIEIVIDLVSRKGIEADLIGVTLFFLLLWGSFALVFYRWARTAKLVISPTHIRCDDITSLAGFSTRWENIRGIEVSNMRLALWLNEPSLPITKVGQWAHKHSVIRPDVIDLSSFIDHWKSGELRQDFEKYAPLLFVSDEELGNHAA